MQALATEKMRKLEQEKARLEKEERDRKNYEKLAAMREEIRELYEATMPAIRAIAAGEDETELTEQRRLQRKAELQDVIATSREKTSLATTKYERYQGHVQRLEEEVKAAKVHAEAAASELQALHKQVSDAERTLIKLQNLRTLDRE